MDRQRIADLVEEIQGEMVGRGGEMDTTEMFACIQFFTTLVLLQRYWKAEKLEEEFGNESYAGVENLM